MNNKQLKIESLLTTLVTGQDYELKPATGKQINLFKKRAYIRKVEHSVIEQLIDLYQVADNFNYNIILGCHSCSDIIIFEWWDDRELWLGQRDFNTLRCKNGKFCIGDAGNISFSEEYECDSLIELMERCIKDINEANNLDKNGI